LRSDQGRLELLRACPEFEIPDEGGAARAFQANSDQREWASPVSLCRRFTLNFVSGLRHFGAFRQAARAAVGYVPGPAQLVPGNVGRAVPENK
jgi:hypothetical protein